MPDNHSLHKRPLSLINRVMLFVSIAISLCLVFIGALVKNAIENHFIEQDTDELVVIIHAVEEAIAKSTTENLKLKDALGAAIAGHHGVFYQVWSKDSHLIYSSTDFDYAPNLKSLQSSSNNHSGQLFYWQSNGNHVRGTMTETKVGGAEYIIVAALDMSFHMEFIKKFDQTLWVILVIAGVITLFAAWSGVHQGHAPLRELSNGLESIQAEHLDMRLDTNTIPKELLVLVTSFNQMMSRLEESFVKLSNFSADIAHELRTPLTNLTTQIQVGLGKKRDLQEYREMLYSSLEELDRLTKMVNDMLWLAKSENGLLSLEIKPLNITQEVVAIIEFFEALADEKGIELKPSGESVKISGDKAMIRRALSNVLANAIRYTPKGKKVEILTWQTEKHVYLKVQNPGQGIDAEHLPKLFDRFYRVDPSRQRKEEGVGLGLAIVKSIVKAHDGSIKADSCNGITSFELVFPKLQPQ